MVSRRDFGIGAALAAAGAAMGPAVRAAAYRAVPQRPSARVIVDNDFAGDPDGLVALAHQLLTPKTRTVLVTASALDRQLMGAVAPERSAAIGADIAAELIRRAGIAAPPPVVAGSEVLNAAAPALAQDSGDHALRRALHQLHPERAADAVAKEKELADAEMVHHAELVVGEGVPRIVDRNWASRLAVGGVALVHGDHAEVVPELLHDVDHCGRPVADARV